MATRDAGKNYEDQPDGAINLHDEDSVKRWTGHFGITEMQLEEAVRAVGNDPGRIREHLLNQGASSGPG